MEFEDSQLKGIEGWLIFHAFWLPVTIIIILIDYVVALHEFMYAN